MLVNLREGSPSCHGGDEGITGQRGVETLRRDDRLRQGLTETLKSL